MPQHQYNSDCRCTDCRSIERNQGKSPDYQPPNDEMKLTSREVEQLETALGYEPPEFKYSRPDTSDRTNDESWTEYWDRKRHERHGPDCGCLLCLNEDELKELGKRLFPPDMRRWVD